MTEQPHPCLRDCVSSQAGQPSLHESSTPWSRRPKGRESNWNLISKFYFSRIKYRKLIILLAVIVLALLSDRFVFTSSGIKIDMQPEVLRGTSEAEITVFRSNLLGFKVPYSSVDVRFAVEEGANLVDIVSESADGKLKLRGKGIEGEAIIGVYNIKSGMQITRLLVKILPRGTAYKSVTSFKLRVTNYELEIT